MCREAGKLGRKQSSLLKEQTASERNHRRCSATPVVWPNDAAGRLVGTAAFYISRIIDFHCLFDLDRVSGRALSLRKLCLTVLLAGNFWRFASRVDSRQTELVACLDQFFTSVPDPVGA